MNGDHGSQRRAARDTQQAWLGERIAQIALQHGPRKAQRATNEKAQDRARQADLGQNEVRHLAVARQADTAWPDQ